MTQAELILAYLKDGGRLTPMDALNKFGCFRLAARVSDLKEDGNDIRTDIIEVGDGKRVAEYWMPRPVQFPVEADGQLSMIGAA